jgi:hypothetical protein
MLAGLIGFVFLVLSSFSHGFITLYVYETSNCVGLPVYAYVNVENACVAGTKTSCNPSTGTFTATQYNDSTCEGNVSSTRVGSTGCNNFVGKGSYAIACSPNIVLSPDLYIKLTFYSNNNSCNNSDITSYAYVPSGKCTSVGTWTSFFAFANSSIIELQTFANGLCDPNGTVDTSIYILGCNSQVGVSATSVNVTATPSNSSPLATKWKRILIIVFSIVGGLALFILIVYLYYACSAKKNRMKAGVTVRT